MSSLQLNAIATRALLDDQFQIAILNGRRRERLTDFDLSEEEIEAVMAIEAPTVDLFIRRLGHLMTTPHLAA